MMKFPLVLAVFVSIVLLPLEKMYGSCYNWLPSGLNYWQTAVNWSGGVVPGYNDAVFLYQGTAVLSGGVTYCGSYNQGHAGSLQIQLGSLLLVDGVAVLDGSLIVTGAENYPCNTSLVLIHAQRVYGQFSHVYASQYVPYYMLYHHHSVEFVIPCIDGAVIRHTNLALPALEVPMEQLVPHINRNIKDIYFNIANTQYAQLVTRLAAIRAGVGPMTLNGLSHEPMPEAYSKRDSKTATPQWKTLADESPRWDIFATATGVFSRLNNVCDLPRTNATTGYFGVGADHSINQYVTVGLYGGYQGIKTCYTEGSRLCSNGLKFGLYATAQYPGFSHGRNVEHTFSKWDSKDHSRDLTHHADWSDNFYLNAIIGGGFNFMNLNRSIKVRSRFVRENRTARSRPVAGELDSLLGGGYEFRLGSWIFGANNSLQYTYLGISRYNEYGARNLNVRTYGQTPSSLVYTLGGNISYLWEPAPNYRILPTVGLAWQHEFLNYGQRINARFANGQGTAFNFYSASFPRNNALGIAGITAQLGHVGLYAYYTPQFGGGRLCSQGVLFGITYAF